MMRRLAVFVPAGFGAALAAVALLPRSAAPPPGELRFTQLTFDAGRAASPAIAPDGAEFAYTLDGKVVVQRLGDSRGLVILPDLDETQEDPSWSPDGRQLAFATPTGLWVCGALGEAPRRVFQGSAGQPSWTPDGEALIYADLFMNATIGGPRVPAVWKIAVGGGAPTRLGELGGADPIVSPDGQALVTTFRGSLFASDSDGHAPTKALAAPSTAWAWSPVYAADGSSMTYIGVDGGAVDVWNTAVTAGRPTGVPRPITTGNAGFIFRIAASPDDQFLIVERFDRVYDVLRIDLGPTPTARLLTHARLPIVGARITSDGERIAFHTRFPSADEVFVMDSDGTDLRRVARMPFIGAIDWAPDGTGLAAAATDGSEFGLWSMSADGADPRPIVPRVGAGLQWLATGELAQIADGKELRISADGTLRSTRPLPDPATLRTVPSQDDRWRIALDGHRWSVTDASASLRAEGPDPTGMAIGAWDAHGIAWVIAGMRVHRVDPVAATDEVVFDLSPWGNVTGFVVDVADDGSWMAVPVGFDHSELWRIDL